MFEVRRAEPADADQLCQLAAGFRDSLGRQTPPDAALLQNLRHLIDSDDAEFFLSVDSAGNARGYVQQRYRFSAWHGAPEATLEDLFVSPESRRAGVATALVRMAIASAQARGCGAIKLDTNERNIEAIRLYERVGFSSASTRFPGSRQLSFEKSL